MRTAILVGFFCCIGHVIGSGLFGWSEKKMCFRVLERHFRVLERRFRVLEPKMRSRNVSYLKQGASGIAPFKN